MKDGFSLVEMLATMSLLVVIFTLLGAGTFRYANRRQTAEGDFEKFKQTLLTAKSNAQSGKKDCRACGASAAATPAYACGTGDVPLDGWQVDINPTSKTYQIFGVCGPTNFWVGNNETMAGSVSLTASSGTGVVSIRFLPSGGAVFTGSSNQIITFTVADAGLVNKQLTVNRNGEIQ